MAICPKNIKVFENYTELRKDNGDTKEEFFQYVINKKILELKEHGNKELLTTSELETSMTVHNAAFLHPLSTVSPDSNPTFAVWQTDARLVNKDNIIPFFRQHPSFIAPLAAKTSVVLRQE
ncbi:hypothetical protein TNCV_4832791 [Trichonephila clavipes]|nr:hypothetical protein TNCV_4832791 [Trichonephila clavipes]